MAPLLPVLPDDFKPLPWDKDFYVPHGAIIKHNVIAFYYPDYPFRGDTEFYVDMKVNVKEVQKIFPTVEPFEVIWECLGKKRLIVQQIGNDEDLSIKVGMKEGLKSPGGYLKWFADSFSQVLVKLVKERGNYDIFLQISEPPVPDMN